MHDAAVKGIMAHGKRHHWCRSSESTARTVIRALQSGLAITDAAKTCGVKYSYAYDIATGKAWRHLR